MARPRPLECAPCGASAALAWRSPPSASWRPWCGTASWRAAMAGAAAAPEAINPRLVSFLPIAREILAHQNIPARPGVRAQRRPAVHTPTIGAVEVAATVELDGQYRALREEAGFLERA